MSKLTITKFRNTGTELIATMNGKEYELSTFREVLMDQGIIPVHEDLWPLCEPLGYFSVPTDEDSDFMQIDGAIQDHEVCGWMKQFTQGKLKKGTYR